MPGPMLDLDLDLCLVLVLDTCLDLGLGLGLDLDMDLDPGSRHGCRPGSSSQYLFTTIFVDAPWIWIWIWIRTSSQRLIYMSIC